MVFFCLEGLLLDGSIEGETRLEVHRGYAQTAFRTLSRHERVAATIPCLENISFSPLHRHADISILQNAYRFLSSDS
jgi:hypothetical protein